MSEEEKGVETICRYADLILQNFYTEVADCFLNRGPSDHRGICFKSVYGDRDVFGRCLFRRDLAMKEMKKDK